MMIIRIGEEMDRKIRKDRAEGQFIEKCKRVLDELDRYKLDVADRAFLVNCEDPSFYISLDKNSFSRKRIEDLYNKFIHQDSVS